MAQENEHVKKLIAARERMIQDRRNLADALANEYKGGHTERMLRCFPKCHRGHRPRYCTRNAYR